MSKLTCHLSGGIATNYALDGNDVWQVKASTID